MIHINIPQKCFDKMSSQYGNEIQQYLKNNCCKISTSPRYIYDILYEVTKDKGLISISTSEMNDVINRIQYLPGWSNMGLKDCKDRRWNSKGKDGIHDKCEVCKCNGICPFQTARIIHDEMETIIADKYDDWIKNNQPFTPYEYIKSLNIKACLYCNLEYAQTTTCNLDKHLRPALDHFYPKSKYPFFAISLNNLVPCCTTCNSYIKGSDSSDLTYINTIHPYNDEKIDYNDCIKYIFMNVPQKVIDNFLKKYGKRLKKTNEKLWTSLTYSENLLIEGTHSQINLTVKEEKEYTRAKIMFDYFKIKYRLEQGHSDLIREITIKAIEYPKDYIEQLQIEGYSKSLSLRLLFGNYVESKDFNQRPLSKITHDVIEQIRPDILEELEKENQS